jgi:hypothetical protein
MSRASAAQHGHDHDRRHRIEAQRAAARRKEVQRRLLIGGGAIMAVIIVVVALVLVHVNSSPGPKVPPNDGPTGTALASTVKDLTTVPASVLGAVGGGNLSTADIGSATAVGGGYLTPVTGSPLTAGGKPEVLYVGANFCPYCAAVRWPLIVALSRFGTFSGLTTTRSSLQNGAGAAEVYPATATWTFYGASYASPYLTFTPVELNTNVPDTSTGYYTTLQALTKAQQSTMNAYDPSGGFPFIDIGNAYVQLSVLAPYSPQDLAGQTWSQITGAITGGKASSLGTEIDASANYLTAAICKVTGDKPATACTPAITALQSRLG